jgi:hypothetical protein
MSALRLITRFVGIVWALVLAALALGIALYCLDGLISLGKGRPDRLLHLVSARKETGHFLAQLQAPGHVAILSLLCGVGAVIVGLLLVKGVLTRPRERLALLERDPAGDLSARRRPLTQMLRSLGGNPRDVREVSRAKLSLARTGRRGRIALAAVRERGSEQASTERSLEQALDPIAKPFTLKTRIRTRLPGTARGEVSS